MTSVGRGSLILLLSFLKLDRKVSDETFVFIVSILEGVEASKYYLKLIQHCQLVPYIVILLSVVQVCMSSRTHLVFAQVGQEGKMKVKCHCRSCLNLQLCVVFLIVFILFLFSIVNTHTHE
jgi:hypothetical protein